MSMTNKTSEDQSGPTKYILIEWPDYQYFMDSPRWKECISVNGPISAFMIPEDLYNEVNSLVADYIKGSEV